MINYAIFSALAAALGMDPEGTEASALIRRAYANPSPARSSPAPDAAAVYWHLVPDSGLPPLREDLPGEGFRFVPCRLNITCYGAEAEALAWRVWQRLYDDGPGAPRRILREAGLYPMPRPPAPLLVWEEAGREHRPRADLTLQLWAAVNETRSSAGAVETPPAVILHRQQNP